MHKLFRFFLFVSVFFCSCLLFSYAYASKPYKNVDKIIVTDANKPLVVKKSSPTFVIVLKSNPTTGYSWILTKYDAKYIQPVGKAFIATKTKLIGAGGYQKLIFTARPEFFNATQKTAIRLIYARPWDMKGANVQNITVVHKNDN